MRIRSPFSVVAKKRLGSADETADGSAHSPAPAVNQRSPSPPPQAIHFPLDSSDAPSSDSCIPPMLRPLVIHAPGGVGSQLIDTEMPLAAPEPDQQQTTLFKKKAVLSARTSPRASTLSNEPPPAKRQATSTRALTSQLHNSQPRADEQWPVSAIHPPEWIFTFLQVWVRPDSVRRLWFDPTRCISHELQTEVINTPQHRTTD